MKTHENPWHFSYTYILTQTKFQKLLDICINFENSHKHNQNQTKLCNTLKSLNTFTLKFIIAIIDWAIRSDL